MNKKGFTLAELLIVVAIIAILVAVSIPIFSSQLTKAKEATNEANARSLYGVLASDYMDNNAVDATINGAAFGDLEITAAGQVTVADASTGANNVFDFNDSIGSLAISTGTDGAPAVVLTPARDGADVVTYGNPA